MILSGTPPSATGQEGRIHNYLRMLWARDPGVVTIARSALEVMIELNNKYAWTAGIPIPTVASSGCWGATTDRGHRKDLSSEPSGT